MYGLSAFAVFAAVAGELAVGGRHISWIWAPLELVALANIFLIFRKVKKEAWHEKWLATRFFAESIRYARVRHPFVLPAEILRKQYTAQGASEITNLSQYEIYLRRLFIEEGLPAERDRAIFCVSRHIDSCIDYAVHVIQGQISYHEKKMHESRHIVHALHGLTHFCFLITGMAVLGHLVIHVSEWLLLTAALPALAASIHGVSEKHEFERLAASSSSTLAELSTSLNALHECRLWSANAPRKWMVMRKIVSEATQSMSDSNRQWQEIVILKNMSLPS
jgi:hypothetical protein